MKKRFLTIISIIALVLGLSATLIACEDGEKIDYSVTVLSPAEEPLSGVTVSWMTGTKESGSAKTDTEGIAKASLPAGTYSIALSGIPEGYEYTEVSVSAAQHDVMVNLIVMKVNYSVTVIDKEGAPAANVTVSWLNGTNIAGTAETNASGAASCKLDYGTYTVTLSDLPEENFYDPKTVSGGNPSTTFYLRSGQESLNYKVTVKSEGGLLFKNESLMVYNGNTPVGAGKTNDEGVFTFSAEAGSYTVRLAVTPDGYSYKPATLTSDALEAEIELKSEVIQSAPSADTKYLIGDIIHNYTFTTPYELNGAIWSKSVSEILAEKDVLLINNWGTNCSWCVKEMPAMQKLYEKYGEQIEIVAISNYGGGDPDAVISDYYEKNGYTFPMMRDNTYNFAYKFGITGWPTTIVIDRYGAIARIEAGAITSDEAWERMLLKYIGTDYVQSFTPGVPNESINNEIAKPDVEVPEDHYEKLAEAIHVQSTFPEGTTIKWYGETEYEYAWPFLFGTLSDVASDDVPVMYASNTGKANSMAIIYADVTVEPGKVLTFKYYSETEQDADILYILWDGRIIREISGDSKGWQTCYLFSEMTAGKHTLAMTYMKNSSGNVGKDNVYLKEVSFVDIKNITESTDMLRGAAYGEIDQASGTFEHYVNVIEPTTKDEYYRVDLTSIEGYKEGLLGVDANPLLLVNLLNVTPWSNQLSINELLYAVDEKGNFVYSCKFDIGEGERDYRQDLTKYLTAANSSDVADCVPVNKFLHDMLVKFMANVSGDRSHENEWLEACYFYSHYGTDNPNDFVGNPILGLMEETAIPVKEGENTADLTRNMYPFPSTIYSFTPETSGVYKIESLIPTNTASQDASQIWLYDDQSSTETPLAYSGDTRITLNGENEQNFVVYYYMTAGHKYYLAMAYQMSQSGTYKYTITKIDETSYTEFVPCSEDIYNMVLDGNGEFTGEISLRGAIEYTKDNDGYFRAKNPDGSMGDYIYLDVTRVTTGALGSVPLNKLIDKYVKDPKDYTNLDYKVFDFRYCVTYMTKDGVTNYDPKVDLTAIDPVNYVDYTEILRDYIGKAPTTGDYAGLIKVDQTLVDILTLYFELRLNSVWETDKGFKIESALDNEWLRFCWYNKTHDSNNP